jgi:hypothetical protein
MSLYFVHSLSSTGASPVAAKYVINDSGCSQHMFHDIRSFTEYKVQQGPLIEIDDNTIIDAVGIATAHFSLPDVGKGELRDALHAPKLGKNLVSPGQSTGTGIKYLLDGNEMIIYWKDSFIPLKEI